MAYKYEATVNGIVEKIGGVENIAHATHCATRFRMIHFRRESLVHAQELNRQKARCMHPLTEQSQLSQIRFMPSESLRTMV